MDNSQLTVKHLKDLFIEEIEEQNFSTHAEWIQGIENSFPSMQEKMRGPTYFLRWETSPIHSSEEAKEHFIASNQPEFLFRKMRQFLANSPEEAVSFLVHKEKVPSWSRHLYLFSWEPVRDEDEPSRGWRGTICSLTTREPYKIKRTVVNEWCGGDKSKAAALLKNLHAVIDELDFDQEDQRLEYLLKWAQ